MTTQAPPRPKTNKRPKRSNEASITRSQAEEICRLWDSDEDLTYAEIGRKLEIRPFTVGRVIRGEIFNFAPELEE